MASFAERLAAPIPTPGGGAAACRTGLHAASLISMVVSITLEKERGTSGERKGGEPELAELEQVGRGAEELAATFRRLERADIAAFEGYLEALRLPRGDDRERAARRDATRKAAREAAEVPMATFDAALGTLDLARRLASLRAGLRLRAESDIGVAVELAHGAARAAELNVLVNLPAVGDAREELEGKLRERAGRLEGEYTDLRREVLGWFAGSR